VPLSLSLGSADAPERIVPEPSGMFLRFFPSSAVVEVAVVVVLHNYCGGGLAASASARLASSLVAQVFAQPTHTRHTHTHRQTKAELASLPDCKPPCFTIIIFGLTP